MSFECLSWPDVTKTVACHESGIYPFLETPDVWGPLKVQQQRALIFLAYGQVLFGDGGWTGAPSQHPTPKIHVACSQVEHFIISDVKRWGNLHNFILLFSTTVSISLFYRKAAVSFLALVIMAKQLMVKWSGMVLGMSSYQFMKQCTLSRWIECLKLWA